MERKALATAFILALLVAGVTELSSMQPASGNFFPESPPAGIQITESGTVTGTNLIQQSGNTYTLTGNLKGTIVVLRDGIVLDGAGYTLEGSGGGAGVFLQARSDVTIENMRITNFEYGIKLTWLNYGTNSGSSGATIADNTLTNNTYGIYINDYSHGNKLSGNTASENTYGMCLVSCYDSVLRDNCMSNNAYNFYVIGATVSSSSHDVDQSNTVNGAPIIYWLNQQGKTVPSNAGYVALVSCTDMTVENLNLAHNGQSILLADVSDSKVAGNTLSNNRNGIYIIDSTNNQIEQNTLTQNLYEGIYLSRSNSNRIAQNTVSGNGLTGMRMAEETGLRGRSGLRLFVSSNNEIVNNQFVGNGEGINLHESNANNINANILKNTLGSTINLFMSKNNQISHNTLEGNDCAMNIWSSPKNTVDYNKITNNSLGILLDGSAENSIRYNNITDNRGFGMQLKSPSALLGGSQNNVIHHNNFINNQAGDGLDVSIPAIMGEPHMGNPRDITVEWLPGLGNVWDDGKEGNYWSDYTTRYPDTREAGDSGTGNTAFVINENNQDNHPLMAPVGITLDEPSTETQTENNSPNFLPTVVLAVVIIVAIAALLIYAKKSGTKKIAASSNADRSDTPVLSVNPCCHCCCLAIAT